MNERIIYGHLIKRKIKEVKYLKIFSTKNLELVIKCLLDFLFCTFMALILSPKERNFEYLRVTAVRKYRFWIYSQRQQLQFLAFSFSMKLIPLLQRGIIRGSLTMSSIKSVSCIHSTYKVVKWNIFDGMTH